MRLPSYGATCIVEQRKRTQFHRKRDLTALLRETLTDVHFIRHLYRQTFSYLITYITLVMSIAVYNVQVYLDLYLFTLKYFRYYTNHTLWKANYFTRISILSWILLKTVTFVCVRVKLYIHYCSFITFYFITLLHFDILYFYTHDFASYMYIGTVTIYWRLN